MAGFLFIFKIGVLDGLALLNKQLIPDSSMLIKRTEVVIVIANKGF